MLTPVRALNEPGRFSNDSPTQVRHVPERLVFRDRKRYDTVVVSDLHLGARNSRALDFLRFLDWVETDRLVVAGDLFDCPRLSGLKAEHVRVVDALRQFARVKQVDWLQGNHDPPSEWFSGLLGLPALEELALDVAGQRYLVQHGHRWDPSLDLPWLVIEAADTIYRGSQWLDGSHQLARRLKRASKYFCRSVEALRRRATLEARDRSFAGVIVGHSHVATDSRWQNVHYLNSGCWTERPACFVGIRHGRARRYYWDLLQRRTVRIGAALAPAVQPASA